MKLLSCNVYNLEQVPLSFSECMTFFNFQRLHPVNHIYPINEINLAFKHFVPLSWQLSTGRSKCTVLEDLIKNQYLSNDCKKIYLKGIDFTFFFFIVLPECASYFYLARKDNIQAHEICMESSPDDKGKEAENSLRKSVS